MSTPDAVTRQWFKEVWNDGDEGAIDRLTAPDGEPAAAVLPQ